MTVRSTSCLIICFLVLTITALNTSAAVASVPEQPLWGFAWSPRQIPVVIQKSPDYAHDAVLQAMQTWNLAQTWFSNTYQVSSRPYTFVEVQELGESYVKITFNHTQTTNDWARWSCFYWNNNGVFTTIQCSTSIILSLRDGTDLSSMQLRNLATMGLGAALGLLNTKFSEMDLMNYYSVDHDVVVPSTLNLYAVALLSMVVLKNDMPKSPVTLPGNIPYETPSESAITELVSAITTTATTIARTYSDSCLQELAYDSGVMDTGHQIMPVGSMFAVRFTPPSKSLLVNASFFISDKVAPFTVRILNAQREFMPVSADGNPTSKGWTSVDFSSFKVEVDSDFYIALQYTSFEWNNNPILGRYQETKPVLGASKGSGERSYDIFNGEEGLEWRPDPSVPAYKVDRNYMIRAVIQTGYPLRVVSPYGEPRGSGCYSFGSAATFSVTSPIQAQGFIGVLGGRYVFDHWSEDSTDITPSASVAMDGPKTVTAMWRIDNTMPYTIIGLVVSAIVIVVALGLLARRRKGSSPTQTYKPPAAALAHPSKAQPSPPANVPALQAQAQDPRYLEYLAKLEQLKTRGGISEETYLKLKDDYWKRFGVPPTAPSPVQSSGVEFPAAKFCISCGTSLPSHATFCNKCGTKQ